MFCLLKDKLLWRQTEVMDIGNTTSITTQAQGTEFFEGKRTVQILTLFPLNTDTNLFQVKVPRSPLCLPANLGWVRPPS